MILRCYELFWLSFSYNRLNSQMYIQGDLNCDWEAQWLNKAGKDLAFYSHALFTKLNHWISFRKSLFARTKWLGGNLSGFSVCFLNLISRLSSWSLKESVSLLVTIIPLYSTTEHKRRQAGKTDKSHKL